MSEMRWAFLPVVLLSLGFFGDGPCVEAAEAKATVQGASHANLRTGPGLNHPAKIILKEGDLLTVEGQEGEWYLVTVADGQKGYVHKTVVKLAGEAQTPAISAEQSIAKPAVTQSNDLNKPCTTDTPAIAQQPSTGIPSTTPAGPANTAQPSLTGAQAGKPESPVRKTEDYRTPATKSPSLIQLLE